jgi:hypothetical protein
MRRIPHGFHGAEIDRSRTIGTVNEDGGGTVGEMPMECYSGLSIRESSTFTYPAMELKEGGGDTAPYYLSFIASFIAAIMCALYMWL